jgi:hypothetical protein
MRVLARKKWGSKNHFKPEQEYCEAKGRRIVSRRDFFTGPRYARMGPTLQNFNAGQEGTDAKY